MKLIKNLLLASFSLLITRDVKNEWSGPKCNNHSNVIIQNISHQSLYSELYNMKDSQTSLIPTLLLITRPASHFISDTLAGPHILYNCRAGEDGRGTRD